MSETAVAPREGQPEVTELHVTGHLMALETGLYCILQSPARRVDAATGLPGVRITPAPGGGGQVEITAFRDDGWLAGQGDAALVRVAQGPAQILVTIYQGADSADNAPRLQVMKLLDSAAGAMVMRPVAHTPAPKPAAQPDAVDLLAHIQGRGDVGAHFGEWVGERGSGQWIEGFAIAPTQGVALADIEYQAVLGRGWLSPWTEGGQFCGSRGMALPVLGLRLRLRGRAAEAFECLTSATFTDGTEVGPVRAGEACESPDLSPLEAVRITLRPRMEAEAPPAAPAPAEATPKKRAARSRKAG